MSRQRCRKILSGRAALPATHRIMNDIFIQIASYRDPQLRPTLLDALQQAAHPGRLHFCVAWQHGEEERREEVFAGIEGPARLTILDIPHEESLGACWARHRIQQEYSGEAYTLQLDSHHRFVEGWDEVLVTMLEGLRSGGCEKPLLTAYLPSFDPESDPAARVMEPWRMEFDRFIPEGAIFFRPAALPGSEHRSEPPRARFYSAHFAFTLGEFARDVQHDPGYYFHGEEISLAVRAFTHGYDLFHPHRLVAWHEYTRKGRAKHWDDHGDWGEANNRSHDSNRKLFGMDEYADRPDEVLAAQDGPFGLGGERRLEEYERYAGICFRTRSITQGVLDGAEPTFDFDRDLSYEDFVASCLPRFRHCIDIRFEQVPLDDYDFWCVAFKDEKDQEIFRQDADEAEIARLIADPDGYCKIWREFDTTVRPRRWVIWPHSRSHGWCEPISGAL